MKHTSGKSASTGRAVGNALSRGGVALALLAATACSPAPDPLDETRVQVIERADTIVTTASEMVGRASALAWGRDGRLWVADALQNRLLVLSVERGEVSLIGREGAGPGEFRRPEALALSDAEVHVYELGNRRLQRLGFDGVYRGSQVPSVVPYVPAQLNARGDLAVPTLGLGGALAAVTFSRSEAVTQFGSAPAPMAQQMSIRNVREQAQRREIPTEFANNVLVLLDDAGGVWLLLQADGTLERYAEGGERLWSHPLPEHYVSAAHERFFAAWRDPGRSVPIPQIATAGAVVGTDAWLLTAGDAATPAEILVVDAEGRLTDRYVLPVRTQTGAMAVHPDRSAVVISLPEEAALLLIRLGE